MSDGTIFGRILLVENNRALVLPVSVPGNWKNQRILLSICDNENVPLASTLVRTAAFSGPNMAIASFMARDVSLHLLPISGSRVNLVASCGLGVVIEQATILAE